MEPIGQFVTVHGLFGLLLCNSCYKLCSGEFEAENGYEIWVHEVEPMIWWLAVNSNRGFTVHMNSVHEIIL